MAIDFIWHFRALWRMEGIQPASGADKEIKDNRGGRPYAIAPRPAAEIMAALK
jgi:hypothetical protein